MGPELFDLDLLEDEDPFEIDTQAIRLFRHPRLGLQHVHEVWTSDPPFYPAKPLAHLADVRRNFAGRVLVVPPAPARSGDPRHFRPIGCYEAAQNLAHQYRRDR